MNSYISESTRPQGHHFFVLFFWPGRGRPAECEMYVGPRRKLLEGPCGFACRGFLLAGLVDRGCAMAWGDACNCGDDCKCVNCPQHMKKVGLPETPYSVEVLRGRRTDRCTQFLCTSMYFDLFASTNTIGFMIVAEVLIPPRLQKYTLRFVFCNALYKLRCIDLGGVAHRGNPV